MLKFTHSADSHLDFMQYGMRQRFDDFFLSTESVFQKSKELGSEFILFAGDIFNSKRPSGESIRRFVELKNKYGIPVYAIDGNHDRSGNAWLEVCGITPINKVLDIKGVKFFGIDSCRPTQFKEKLIELSESGESIDVLAMHQAVMELFDYGSSDYSLSWLVPACDALGVKYVALGDIHTHCLKEIDGIKFSYPSAPEPTSISQVGGTGFMNFVTIDDNKVDVEKIKLKTREFIRLSSEDDNSKVLNSIDDNNKPFIILEHKKGDALDIIELLKEKDIMYQSKLVLINEDTDEKQETFDRYDAIKYVRQVTSKFFSEDKDEYQLTVQILDNPDDGVKILKNYLLEKGITT